MSYILMTSLFYRALILQGEIWCWSLLGFKELRRLQNLYLSKGVGPWIFVKNLKFLYFFFFGQISQENVFMNGIFEKTFSRLIEIWI